MDTNSNSGDPVDKWKYWQPVYEVDGLKVSGIISNYQVSHFYDTFPTGVNRYTRNFCNFSHLEK